MHWFVANPHQNVTEVLPLRIKPFYIRHYLRSWASSLVDSSTAPSPLLGTLRNQEENRLVSRSRALQVGIAFS